MRRRIECPHCKAGLWWPEGEERVALCDCGEGYFIEADGATREPVGEREVGALALLQTKRSRSSHPSVVSRYRGFYSRNLQN